MKHPQYDQSNNQPSGVFAHKPDVVSGILADVLARHSRDDMQVSSWPGCEQQIAVYDVHGQPLRVGDSTIAGHGHRVDVTYGTPDNPRRFTDHTVSCDPEPGGSLHVLGRQVPERVSEVRALLRAAIVGQVIDDAFASMRAEYGL